MKPAEKFENHHQELIGNFNDHLQAAQKNPGEHLERLVEFLRNDLLPHAEAEEAELYSTVDEKADTELATASMRHDHRQLERRIDELDSEEEDSEETIRTKLDEFSAILLNHFRKEEQLLVPFLEDVLSQQEFEDVLGRVHDAEQSLHH